jgi:hypothetical protein
MSAPATELRPHAVGGVVYNDVVSRTLFVRLPDAASGHDRSLWRQAHQRLVAAEQAGWPVSEPWLWAHGAGKRDIAHGLPGDAATIKFAFAAGQTAYSELVGKPRLSAIVVIDSSACRFLHVAFRHGLEPV